MKLTSKTVTHYTFLQILDTILSFRSFSRSSDTISSIWVFDINASGNNLDSLLDIFP